MISEEPLTEKLEGACGEHDLPEDVMVCLESLLNNTQDKTESLRVVYIYAPALSVIEILIWVSQLKTIFLQKNPIFISCSQDLD